MSTSRFLRAFFRKTGPVMYAVTVFTKNTHSEMPSKDKRLQLDPPDPKDFTFDYMIKQSALNTVNSTSQILTVTYTAIETTSKEYRFVLGKLISLLDESVMYDFHEAYEDEILRVRAEVQQKKETLTKLLGFMDSVHKMALSTSEVTFMSGMDDMCTTLCQRIDDAMNNIQREVELNKQLEEEYNHTQLQCIKKTKTNEDQGMSKDQKEKEQGPLHITDSLL